MTRRSLRTPKAFFHVEDLAILLLIHKVRNTTQTSELLCIGELLTGGSRL